MDTHTAYLWGVTAGVAGAFLHAGANIFDSYLSNRLSQRLSDLVALSATTNLLFLPIVALVETPHWIGGRNLALVVPIATINVFYHFPYFWALQDCDTSVVSSLFSLGKVFTPLLAFLILRETLVPIQYAGFFVIVIASTWLTFDRGQLRFRKALPYMLCVSIVLIFEAILFKTLYASGVSWGSSVVWAASLEFVIATLLVVALGRVRALVTELGGLGKRAWLVLLNQFFTWSGEVLGLAALTLVPVSVYEGLDSAQPMFVLVISLFAARRFPQFFQEELGTRTASAKALLFVAIVVGTLMIVHHE
jgi:drug/metabolite transporter (DMT)-like permease